MNQFDLSNKVAIVTGASRGIGEAIAWAFVAAGANVVITGRSSERVDAAAAAINLIYPGRALPIAAHAGEPDSAKTIVDQAVTYYDRVDIAVNNAATNPHFGPLLEAGPSHWDKILDVNVKGYFYVCQAAAQQMIRQGQGGKLINVASIAGLEPGPMMGVYSVSKAAVIMLTKVLAVELGKDHIQVNAIAPGFVKTKFSAALWQNATLAKGLTDRTPAGRMADAKEITGAALYLASAASDFTTGAVLTVDRGYTLT